MNKLGRGFAIAIFACGLMPLAGCRICADCEDRAYPAYGGAWERTLRDSGRVGSLFDPAGGQTSTLVDRDQPETPDVLERLRQERRAGAAPEPQRELPPPAERPPVPQRRDRTEELRERRLEDIQTEQEERLRDRRLDEIDIQVVPPPPLPAALH